MRWSWRAAIGAMTVAPLALLYLACAPFDADDASSPDPDAAPPDSSMTSADASSDEATDEAAPSDASASVDAGVEGLVLQKARSPLGTEQGSSATFGVPIATGSLVAVFAYALGDIDLRISDSDKNDFTALGAVRSSMGSGRWFYCEHAIATGKVDVVRLTVSPVPYVYGVVAFELRPNLALDDQRSSFAAEASGFGSGTGLALTPEIATTERSLLLAAAWATEADHLTFSAGSGFTELGRDDFFMFLAEAQIVPSGTHRASVQFPSGIHWGISAAAFRRPQLP